MTKSKQKRRADVPDDHHIARHCNPQRVIRDPETRAILGVFPQAFALRTDIRELYLSAHWMECFGTDVDAQFQSVVRALRNKREVRPRSAVARLVAGRVVAAGKAQGYAVRIRDRSSADDPGYSGVYGLPTDNSDIELLAALANQCCIEVRGAAEIDASASPKQ